SRGIRLTVPSLLETMATSGRKGTSRPRSRRPQSQPFPFPQTARPSPILTILCVSGKPAQGAIRMSMHPNSSSGPRPWELEYARDDKGIVKFFNVVYAWMAVGLAVTAAVAYFVSQSQAGLQIVYGG